VTLFEATGDGARSRRRSGASASGDAHDGARGITHDANEKPSAILHLADNAAFGLALMQLYESKGGKGDARAEDDSARREYLEAAVKIGDLLLRELADERGAFFASSADPDAVGVFAARRKPFEDNATALRFFARLARAKANASTDDPRIPRRDREHAPSDRDARRDQGTRGACSGTPPRARGDAGCSLGPSGCGSPASSRS